MTNTALSIEEEKALALVIQRHNRVSSENDIRVAFMEFLRISDIAEISNMSTETPPGVHNPGHMDLYVYNTCIEFKRNLIRKNAIDPEAVSQLDRYLELLVEAGTGVQNGILTDGVNYLIRHIGANRLPLEQGEMHTVFDNPSQAVRLREYLFRVLAAPASGIKPIPENLTRWFGATSDLFYAANTLLWKSHLQHRNTPTVAVKRKLWQELLQVALGQNSAADNPEKDWLFIRHTYLTTLVSIIVQAHFGLDVVSWANKQPQDLLNGRLLERHTDLRGVIESDLFGWPMEVGQREYIRLMAKAVSRFDWDEQASELASTLYQNTVTPEERKAMGEYYTPMWLAQAIVTELVPDPVNTRMLDPACGSGTFIEAALRYLLEKSAALNSLERLALLQHNIAGIDLHPVAVQLAKATWVINCRQAITVARQGNPELPAISPPIYLGDSLQLRNESSELFGQEYIRVRTGEAIPGLTQDVELEVPLSLALDTQRFDNLMVDIAGAVEEGSPSVQHLFDRHAVHDEGERALMNQTVERMMRLHAAGRNHVWAYYLRNMTRPVVLSNRKVGAIVGNPPWLNYSDSADIIRSELREMSANRYGIWAGGRQAPHQDVATLFFCRVAELYLAQDGVIGMVMPHSVLRSGQHLRFRSGQYEETMTRRGRRSRPPKTMTLDFGYKASWDLDLLDSDVFLSTFPMPASVVFGRLARPYALGTDLEQGRPLAPGKVEIWQSSQGSNLTQRILAHLHHDDGQFHSPYAHWASQGPTIVDRRLFFVTATPNPVQTAPPGTWKTRPRLGTQDKKNYDVSALVDLPIHENNLFDIYLGETLAPFVTLPPLRAVLPVLKSDMVLPLDHSQCERDASTKKCRYSQCKVDVNHLDARMRYRWEIMEELWERNKGKTNCMTLIQNLNYLRKLTKQLEYLRNPADRPVRIGYTTNGRPTAALIHKNDAILDTKLYQVSCRSLEEAYYLLAIINSTALAKAVKPLCTTNWAKEIRDLHKHLWKLPIPEFDPDDGFHIELAALGRTAEAEARGRFEELRQKRRTAPSSDTVRDELRNNWQEPLKPPRRIRKRPNQISSTTAAIEHSVNSLLSCNQSPC